VFFPSIYYITFPVPRYRHPVEPAMLILIVFLASQFKVSGSQFPEPGRQVLLRADS